MGKIYDTQGNKMNVQQILGEVVSTITDTQSEVLGRSLIAYNGVSASDRRMAHAILDSYKYIDGTTPQGERMRRLCDNLMTKYQKSIGNISVEDSSAYHSAICDIIRKSGLEKE